MPNKLLKWVLFGMVALFATFGAAPSGGNGSGQSDDDSDGGLGDDEKVDLSALPDPVRRLFEKMQRSLSDANSEAKDRRLELKREREAASQQMQARLAEEGRWKELAEERARQVAELMPHKTQAEEMAAAISASNQRRIALVPEGMRVMIPMDYPPQKLSEFLDRAWDTLTIKSAPNTDAGAGSSGGGKKPVKLTAQQKEMADATGVSYEKYAENLAALQAERGRNIDDKE